MAAKKKTSKAAKKSTATKKKATKKKAPAKKKSAATKKAPVAKPPVPSPAPPQAVVPAPTTKPPAPQPKSSGSGSGLRIRMYRVGFGDFFLMTVPSADGPQHIVIDCGVTAGQTKQGDIGTIKSAVADMAKETNNKLALVIVTHRHQDHIVGFSRSAEIWQKFEHNVDAVWMSAWENEYDPNEKKGKSLAANFQEELTALAFGMQQHLAASDNKPEDANEIAAMLENATGIAQADLAAAGSSASQGTGKGGGSNAASLNFLKQGLGVTPQYYAKGDTPTVPPALVKAGLIAEILGPPPTGDTDFMKLMDLKKGVGQYLGEESGGDDKVFDPGFGPYCCIDETSYPPSAFREWERANKEKPHLALEAAIKSAQPATLLTAATTLDSFLNNQSLVVLFTFNGQKLLFAGDAQGGNWEYWMFGGTPTKTPSLDKLEPESKEILSSLVFYKVGHHGSTNATPMSAVEAMGASFDAMCSTQFGSFGSVANQSEVPRGPLIDALRKKSTLVRSDEIPVTVTGNEVAAVVKDAPTPQGKKGRFVIGPIYVDWFPD